MKLLTYEYCIRALHTDLFVDHTVAKQRKIDGHRSFFYYRAVTVA